MFAPAFSFSGSVSIEAYRSLSTFFSGTYIWIGVFTVTLLSSTDYEILSPLLFSFLICSEMSSLSVRVRVLFLWFCFLPSSSQLEIEFLPVCFACGLARDQLYTLIRFCLSCTYYFLVFFKGKRRSRSIDSVIFMGGPAIMVGDPCLI